MMTRWMRMFMLAVILAGFSSVSLAEDLTLQYFLAKATSKEGDLSITEKTELLNRIEEVMGRARQTHQQLIQMMLSGDVPLPFQEGHFWMSKFKEDETSIETGFQQLKLMKDKPLLLAPPILLYKVQRDLASNFNAYNNMPSFSSFVGDVGPELELWADPVFIKLFLLPLLNSKDKEAEAKSPSKEKKPNPKK
jgi:hypothetical protein